MVRNTLKHVYYKDMKPFVTDLKTTYYAQSEKTVRTGLDKVSEKWGQKYPYTMKRWYDNWDALCPIFKFSMETRKIIYTTNAIESVNSTYKKLNRQRSVFPSSTALLKTLYLSILQITKKWSQVLKNWVGYIRRIQYNIWRPDAWIDFQEIEAGGTLTFPNAWITVIFNRANVQLA